MLPINGRSPVHKPINVGGHLLVCVARIGPRRRIEAVLDQQIAKIKISLRAAGHAKKRVRRLLVPHVAVAIACKRFKPFVTGQPKF